MNNYYARINGIDYPISWGFSIGDEFGEALDSGNITLPHVRGVIDIKPYDDVVIHNIPEMYNGRPFGIKIGHNGFSDITGKKFFYWHFLAWSLSRDRISLGEEIFNYRISLISETKGLETIQIPNRAITQPMRTDRDSNHNYTKTVRQAVDELVDLYSPRVKVSYIEDGETLWKYQKKYSVSLNKRFDDMICPEMTLSGTNLKEAINQLLMVGDSICTVHDDVIMDMNLSERGQEFNSDGCHWDTWQMDGSSYCDRLRTEYSGALSSSNVTHMVERLGFKNQNSPVMTLGNMQLELTYPIYEIQKVKMCYWKKVNGKLACIKQDISPLVIRNEKRNLLSEDWTTYDLNKKMYSVEDLAKFKFATVGYSQGSKVIGGWGQRYTQLEVGWLTNFTNTRTVLENLFDYFNQYNSLGENYDSIISDDNNIIDWSKTNVSPYNIFEESKDNRPSFANENGEIVELNDNKYNIVTNLTLFLKSLFFEVEYQAYVSATVISSKDDHDGHIVIRDGQEGSLPYVESQGEMKKEKVNRLGNASISVNARYSSFYDIQQLSSVWNEGVHNDEVVYRRNIVFERDFFRVSYYLCKDYVLKNYFTSVYAKNRPFAYASQGETLERRENKSLQILLSFDKSYYQSESSQIDIGTDDIKKVVSFFKENSDVKPLNISYQYILGGEDGPMPKGVYYGMFATDYQSFVSGSSLVFNINTQDSIGAGTYIRRWGPVFSNYVGNIFKNIFQNVGYDDTTIKTYDDITGSIQDWYIFPTNKETGAIDEIHYGVGCSDRSEVVGSQAPHTQHLLPQVAGRYITKDNPEGELLSCQYYWGKEGWVSKSDVSNNNETITEMFSAVFSGDNGDKVYKDGKERMNLTMQFEMVADDGISISSKAPLLSDVIGRGKRYSQRINGNGFQSQIFSTTLSLHKVRAATVATDYPAGPRYDLPVIAFAISPEEVGSDISSVTNDSPIEFEWDNNASGSERRALKITINKLRFDDECGKYSGGITYKYGENDSLYVPISNKTILRTNIPGGDIMSDGLIEMLCRYSTHGDGAEKRFKPVISTIPTTVTKNTYILIVTDDWGGIDDGSSTSSFEMNDNYIPDRILHRAEGSLIPSVRLKSYPSAVTSVNEYYLSSSPQMVISTISKGNQGIVYYESEKSNRIFLERVERQNLFWALCNEKMGFDTPYEQLRSLDGKRDVTGFTTCEYDDDNYDRLSFTVSMSRSGLPNLIGDRSLRLYYLENNRYYFVFGVNLKEGEWGKKVFVSTIDDRSRKVIDSQTSEYRYTIHNYAASDNIKDYGNGLNYCDTIEGK